MTISFGKCCKNFVTAFFLLFIIFSVSEDTNAQRRRTKITLRSQIAPNCTVVPAGAVERWKFADIYADGNIAVQGSYNCRGAFIYDISNPDAPTLSAHYNPGGNQRFLEAIVVGNRGYFGSGNGGGVHIVDLTNPQNPQLLGIVNSTSGNGHNSVHEMLIWGNYLIENFNGFSNKLLKVINISNPANPVFIRDINPTEIQWVHAMHIRGNRMFTSGWGNSSARGRTEIYDISSIETQAPTLLGFIEDATSTTAGNNMHSSWSSEDGNYLYSCRETNDGDGDLRTYDIHDPAQPFLVNRITMTDLGINAVTPHNPVVVGNYLYVAWYQAGLQVFNISNPSTPVRSYQYDTYAEAYQKPEPTDRDDSAKSKELTEEPWDMICGGDNLQNNLPTGYDGNWAVYPFLGRDKVLLGDMTNGLLIVDVPKLKGTVGRPVSDFDSGGKMDFSVYEKNSGAWQIENSSNTESVSDTFGAAADKSVAGDYDGDGKLDYSIWRPNDGTWHIQTSTGGMRVEKWGIKTDVPVPADFDGDGRTDLAVWRPSTGVWYISNSTLGFKSFKWGAAGDRVFAADYDTDGKPDLVAYRPSNGTWYILQSSNSQSIIRQFGMGDDQPLAGDFDGDEKADFAVYRRSEGKWYLLNSISNSLSVYNFGAQNDLPIPADYDGDGKTDIAVFRPETNTWLQLNSSDGNVMSKNLGQKGEIEPLASLQP